MSEATRELQRKAEYRTIWHLVSAIAEICGCSPEKIIDDLTGYAWDEEEASGIKGSNVELTGGLTAKGETK